MLLALRSLLLLTAHTVLVTAQSNTWIYPPPGGKAHDYSSNQNFVVGSKINLQWTTNYTQLSVVIYQNDNATFQYLHNAKEIPALSSYSWEVTLDYDNGNFNLDHGNIFFFDIYAEDDAHQGQQFTSHYFNITDNKAASSPTSTSTSTGGSGVIPATTTDASTAATTTTTSAATTTAASSSSGMSASTKVGVGVGVGVGVSALLIGAAIGYLWHRQRGKRAQPTTPEMDGAYGGSAVRYGGDPKPPPSPAGHQQSHYAPQQQPQMPAQEMPARGQDYYEMDGISPRK